METQMLMLVAICGFLSVSEALECYSCLRHEVGLLTGGNNEKHCEKVSAETPKISQDCKACVMDTMDIPGYDYLKRYCWTEDGECKSGKIEKAIVDIPAFGEPSYTLDRTCCTDDDCNNEFWDADSSATTVHVTGSVLAAILVSLYL